jgi:hypothetical protein
LKALSSSKRSRHRRPAGGVRDVLNWPLACARINERTRAMALAAFLTGSQSTSPTDRFRPAWRAHPVRTFGEEARKRERVSADWPVYPRLAHTMRASTRSRNSASKLHGGRGGGRDAGLIELWTPASASTRSYGVPELLPPVDLAVATAGQTDARGPRGFVLRTLSLSL